MKAHSTTKFGEGFGVARMQLRRYYRGNGDEDDVFAFKTSTEIGDEPHIRRKLTVQGS